MIGQAGILYGVAKGFPNCNRMIVKYLVSVDFNTMALVWSPVRAVGLIMVYAEALSVAKKIPGSYVVRSLVKPSQKELSLW